MPDPSFESDPRALALGLLEAAPDAILVVRTGGKIALANRMAERMFGYDRAELLDQPVEMLVPEANRGAHYGSRERYERAPRLRMMSESSTLRAVRKDGSVVPVEIALSPIEGPGGRMTIAVVRDVTHRVELEEKLRYASTHDELTGAFNRAYLELRRAELDARHDRTGILLVDVDELKPVNDRLGHAAGDQLLRRTSLVLRSAAGPEDEVVRLGGDEFAILCLVHDEPELLGRMRHLREELARHNDLHRGSTLSLSVGAAMCESKGGLSRAMRIADQRMYAEKRRKRAARESAT